MMTFFIIFSFTLIFSLFANPLAMSFFARLKRAKSSVPLVGGSTILVTLLALSFTFKDFILPTYFYYSIPIFFLGLADDLYDLSASKKLPLELLCAVLFVLNTDTSSLFVSTLGLPDIVSKLMCALWIVAITNAYNLTDGINGLLSSLVIASSTIIFAFTTDILTQFFLIALIGCIAGFLPYNMSRKYQAYLGDSGSLWLGFLMSSVALTAKFNFTGIPNLLFVMALFCYSEFDSAYAFFRRLFTNRSLIDGDRNHIHHLLVKIGLKDYEASLFIVAVSAVIAISFVPINVLYSIKIFFATTLGIFAFLTVFRVAYSSEEKQHSRFFLIIENKIRSLVADSKLTTINPNSQLMVFDIDKFLRGVGLLKDNELEDFVEGFSQVVYDLLNQNKATYFDRKIILQVSDLEYVKLNNDLTKSLARLVAPMRVRIEEIKNIQILTSFQKTSEPFKKVS